MRESSAGWSYSWLKKKLRSQYGSTTVLEHLLSYEGCDVDLQNRLERDTPLHAAIKHLNLDPELRNYVVESLLEAGADPKYVASSEVCRSSCHDLMCWPRIKDKNGDIVLDLVSSSSKLLDDQLRSAIRKAGALASVSKGDIADGQSTYSFGNLWFTLTFLRWWRKWFGVRRMTIADLTISLRPLTYESCIVP